MDFKLQDEQLNALVTKAVIDGLSDEAKIGMVQTAIHKFLHEETKNSGYGRRSTAFGEILASAVRETARKAVLAEFEKDGTKEKITQAVSEAFTKAFETTEKRDKMISNMTDAIAEAFKIDRY